MDIYEKLLPAEFLKAIKSKLSTKDGYIRFINPFEAIDGLRNSAGFSNGDIPFAVTGMGEVFIWKDGTHVALLKPYTNQYKSLSSSPKLFVDDFEYLSIFIKGLDIEEYLLAKKRLGALDSGKCYTLAPLPIIGGCISVDNLEKGNFSVYLEIIAQFLEMI